MEEDKKVKVWEKLLDLIDGEPEAFGIKDFKKFMKTIGWKDSFRDEESIEQLDRVNALLRKGEMGLAALAVLRYEVPGQQYQITINDGNGSSEVIVTISSVKGFLTGKSAYLGVSNNLTCAILSALIQLLIDETFEIEDGQVEEPSIRIIEGLDSWVIFDPTKDSLAFRDNKSRG